jgi:tRNA threonylcarbamoyladenosine biosynthesis protein TsaE
MNAANLVIETSSPRETKAWARRLASLLQGGELIALIGDLGAGKTCFVKGLGRGLNLREEQILSPTFTMIQEHHGRLPLYHIDLYRLERVTLDDLGLREYLFSEGIAAVEWYDRLDIGETLDRLSIHITFSAANTRKIEFIAVGDAYRAIVESLRTRVTDEQHLD